MFIHLSSSEFLNDAWFIQGNSLSFELITNIKSNLIGITNHPSQNWPFFFLL